MLFCFNAVTCKNEVELLRFFSWFTAGQVKIFQEPGAPKASILPKILNAAIDSPFPASRIGTPDHKALFILDTAAASQLISTSP